MIDKKTSVAAQLASITPTIPVYYELFCDSMKTFPCITYIENQNSDVKTGNTIGYSQLGFTIKVWGTKISSVDTYAGLVDTKMRGLGFIRTSSNELTYNDQIQKVLMYQALGKETY